MRRRWVLGTSAVPTNSSRTWGQLEEKLGLNGMVEAVLEAQVYSDNGGAIWLKPFEPDEERQ